MELRIPADVADVLERLQRAGHEAYAVGGCVRDALRGVVPQDWDVATDAKPEAIQGLFQRSLYTNRFGTVVVRTPEREVEVTTYRVEADYADHRRPTEVSFTASLEADLSRRDFTMNAMALRPFPPGHGAEGAGGVAGGSPPAMNEGAEGARGVAGAGAGAPELRSSSPAMEIVDPFGGRVDLEARIIRAVGDPDERFREDALRMLRAVRFAAVLGMSIGPGTAAAITRNAALASELSGERVQQELVKMLLADRPSTGFRVMSELGLLAVIAPELERCRTVPQDKAVAEDVFEHSLITLDAVTEPDLVLRLAALLHDIGKPDTFADGHFHQHEFVGEHLTRQLLRRWRFSKDVVAKVSHLVRHHMFWYQDDWTGSAVRRFIRKVGLDDIPLLFELRRADNIGSGARPGRMFALEQLWDRVQEELHAESAFSTRDLKVDGNDLMADLGLRPGPEVGRIMNELFERVLEDPELNERDTLLRLAREISRG